MSARPFLARLGLLSTGLISANLTGALTIAAPPANTAAQFVNGNGNGGITRVIADTYMGIGGGYASFAGRAARGSASVPTALQSGDEITHLSAWGYGATGFSSAGRGMISIFAGENWTDVAQGTRIGFYTTAPGGIVTSEKMRLWGDGGVTISSTLSASPGTAALSVGGVFTCLADTASPWTATFDAAKGTKTFGMLNTVSGVSTNGPLIIGFGNTGFQTASTAPLLIGSNLNNTNTGNSNVLVVGYNTTLPATASNAVIIGNAPVFASANCSSSIVIGRVSDSGLNCVVIGRTAVGAQDSVVIGSGATASGSNNAVVLGRNASSGGFATSGAIGSGALATAASQIRIGSTATPLALNVTGVLRAELTTASTSSVTGSTICAGGLGVADGIFANGGTISARDGVSDTARLRADGGGGWTEYYQSGAAYCVGQRAGGTGLRITAGLISGGGITAFAVNGTTLGAGTVQVFYTTASSSSITGALTVAGGAGIAGALYTGGIVVTPASALGSAGLRLPHGVAPTTPVDGDVWTTTAGMFARINGATVGPFGAGGGTPGGASTNIQFNDAGTFNGEANFTYDKTIKTVTLLNAGESLEFDGTTATITGLNTAGDYCVFGPAKVSVNLVGGSFSELQPAGNLILNDGAGGVANIVAATGLFTLATSYMDGVSGSLFLSDSTPNTITISAGVASSLTASTAFSLLGPTVTVTGTTNTTISCGSGPVVLDAPSGQSVLSQVLGVTKLTVDTSGVTATVPVTATRLIGTQGTIVTNLQGLSTTATWNSGGTTFTGWKQNITDTASAAASLLVDLQVGGVSKFSVGKAGTANIVLGTITTDIKALDASATWNSAGTTFAGIKLNVTNTASGANSVLMDLQIGGSTVFAVNKAGGAYIQDLTYGTTGLQMSGQASNPSPSSPDTTLWVDNSANNFLRFDDKHVAVRDGYITDQSTSGGSITPDGTVADIIRAELTANTTIAAPTMLDGQTMVLVVYNTATPYTLAWNAAYDWGAATAPAAPAANEAVIVTVVRVGASYYASAVEGFAKPV